MGRQRALPLDETLPEKTGKKLRLSLSPGRVAPRSAAFTLEEGEGVRRSLAAELKFDGRTLFVVANHLSSKSDDDRAFGSPQPPRTPTLPRRLAQAKEVRAFVGLASYYRRFVKDFARVAGPLHDLTKKNSVFTWSTDAQRSFEELKKALTSPPILAMPSDTGEFLLDTDASDGAIGAVLSQRQDGVERVIANARGSLDRRETTASPGKNFWRWFISCSTSSSTY